MYKITIDGAHITVQTSDAHEKDELLLFLAQTGKPTVAKNKPADTTQLKQKQSYKRQYKRKCPICKTTVKGNVGMSIHARKAHNLTLKNLEGVADELSKKQKAQVKKEYLPSVHSPKIRVIK